MWVTCLVIRKEYQSDRDGKQRSQDSTSVNKSPKLILVLSGWSADHMSACWKLLCGGIFPRRKNVLLSRVSKPSHKHGVTSLSILTRTSAIEWDHCKVPSANKALHTEVIKRQWVHGRQKCFPLLWVPAFFSMWLPPLQPTMRFWNCCAPSKKKAQFPRER